MEVKIYREKENESLIINESELSEYNSLMAELGLKESKTENVPNVYMCLNFAMKKQLNAICPVSVNIENYTRSTIPLEVLKVYKFAKENSMFDGFEVWYDDISPDPMLMGWSWMSEEDKEKGYSWRKNIYLIARWGDCALEINELCALGFNRIKQQLCDKAFSAIEKCNSIMKNPDVYVNKILSNNASDMQIDLNTSNSLF